MRAAIISGFLLLSGMSAAADDLPGIIIDRPSIISVPGEKQLDIPPGVFIPQPTFDKVDAEVKRLQTSEKSLKLQNENLGYLLSERPAGFGLKGLGISFGVGVILGIIAAVIVIPRS